MRARKRPFYALLRNISEVSNPTKTLQFEPLSVSRLQTVMHIPIDHPMEAAVSREGLPRPAAQTEVS